MNNEDEKILDNEIGKIEVKDDSNKSLEKNSVNLNEIFGRENNTNTDEKVLDNEIGSIKINKDKDFFYDNKDSSINDNNSVENFSVIGEKKDLHQKDENQDVLPIQNTSPTIYKHHEKASGKHGHLKMILITIVAILACILVCHLFFKFFIWSKFE